MRVYLAGRFSAQQALREWREELEKRGHRVVSRWLDAGQRPPAGRRRIRFMAEWAEKDLIDLESADAIILRTSGGTGRQGGLYVEFGYAIATDKMLFMVGPRTNAFTYLRSVWQYQDFSELLGSQFFHKL